MRTREKQRRLKQLAKDILASMYCDCNDDGRPEDCECGGDNAGTRDPAGCWKCQAYTALHGYGRTPKDRAS